MERQIHKKIIIADYLFAALFILFIILFFLLPSCKTDKELGYKTTSDVNIASYLTQHPDSFSLYVELLHRKVTITNGSQIKYAGFLDAYGAYTCFVPTNEAIIAYVKEKGLTSVSDFTDEEVRNILNLHILQDTISTSKFTDGKLNVPTMYGQYLVTSVVYNGSRSNITINKTSNIIESNLLFANGIVHVIDKVLEPAKLTIAETLAQKNGFTIFNQALRETGFYDTLNYISDADPFKRHWYTVFAVSDSIFKTLGIQSIDELKSKISSTNPLSPKDSLFLYVGYHILPSLNFMADIVTASSHKTEITNQVITIKLSGDTILINEDLVNGKIEKGVSINRGISDVTATNGVVHYTNGNYAIKVRKPQPLYFDLCDYPELHNIGLAQGWGKAQTVATNYNLTSGQVSGINWEGGTTGQVYMSANNSAEDPAYVYYNFLAVKLRSSSAVHWIEFNTPFLAAGKYKVWISWRRAGSPGMYTQGSVDGDVLPIIFDTNDYLPGRSKVGGVYQSLEDWDKTLNSIGYKRTWQTAGKKTEIAITLNCRYLGIADIKTSSTHKFRITALTNASLSGSGSGAIQSFDMVQFIPKDDDQVWPKFDKDGTVWPRPASPYDDKVTPVY